MHVSRSGEGSGKAQGEGAGAGAGTGGASGLGSMSPARLLLNLGKRAGALMGGGEEAVPPSPGPVGPGIKARMMFHLKQQQQGSRASSSPPQQQRGWEEQEGKDDIHQGSCGRWWQ